MRTRLVSALFVATVALPWIQACGSSGASEPPTATGGTSAAGGNAGAAGSSTTGGTGGTATGGAGGTGGALSTGGSGGATGGTGGTAGSAGDGGVTVCPPDEDFDSVPDDVEGRAQNVDTDHDGTADYLDSDSDGDGVPDSVERGDPLIVGCQLDLDSDNDGKPNRVDTDSDGNGILDANEGYVPGQAPSDVDGDETPDMYDDDDDDDGLEDTREFVGGQPVDTDHDGKSDHQDIDSDGDTVGDRYESDTDADHDGTPNFRDLDSDKDAVPDACEAGFNHLVTSPPANSDADNAYDFADIDSDNDGLTDGLEDSNYDCVVDVGETDRTKSDTDDDNASDLIEQQLGSDPADPLVTPQSLGRYYFVMPYNQTPIPSEQDVVLKTNLNKGDIAFVIDGTGTMAGALDNLRSNVSKIANAVRAEVPDAHFGVLAAEEYPVAPYGNATGSNPNQPVRIPGPTAYLSGLDSNLTSALNAFTLNDGGDGPEAQLTALYRALNNTTLIWPAGGTLPPFANPNGGFGSLGFRSDALPILVLLTDAPFHNGRWPLQGALHDKYCTATDTNCLTQAAGAPSFGATVDDVIAEMNGVGAKMVGVALDGGGPARSNKDPYRDMATLVDATKSYVKPYDAFKTNQCLTDIAGNPSNPDGPNSTCRMIFSTYANGSGASNSVIDGVKALLRGIKIEVRITAVSVPSASDPVCQGRIMDAVDDFIESIEVNPVGGVLDPADLNFQCETLPLTDLRDEWEGPRGVINLPDGLNEKAANVVPGIRVCFKIVPKPNSYCPQTGVVQKVRASLEVRAKNEGQTDELIVGEPRDVFFLIPPTFQ